MNENDYESWQDYPLVRYVWSCIALDGAGEQFLNAECATGARFEVPSGAICTVLLAEGRTRERAVFHLEGRFTEADFEWATKLVGRGCATVVDCWCNDPPAYFVVCPFDEYSPF